MCKSSIFFSLALFLVFGSCLNNVYAQQITSNFDPNVMCSMIKNGTMINDPRACNTWFQCVDGEPVSGVCGEGLFYNRETFACVPADSVTCLSTSPCATELNPAGVFVADPYSCQSYFYCNGSTMVKGECSEGRYFNPETRLCSASYVCTQKIDPDSYCNIVPDGVFIKVTDSCTDYQMCWNQVIVNNTCPSMFHFDPFNGVCDYGSKSDCPSATPEPISKCVEANVFISDGHTCNGYYYCMSSGSADNEFTMMPGTCPDGWFFDSIDGGACVPRTRIKCEFNRCAGMGQNQIQLANESNDGCHGYSVCQNGEQIGTGTCPDGEYFDEMIQFCTSNVIAYPACVLVTTTDTTVTAITEASTTTTAVGTTSTVSDLKELALINVPEVQY